jgi:tryptophan synthase beta chain
MFAYLLRDKDRQVSETNSISACLDYPRVGPEDAMLKDMNRAFYAPCTGDGAVDAFMTLPRLEGTIPSPESSRAIAHATKTDREMDRNGVIVATLSGRGDKDVTVVLDYLNSKKGRRHNAGK